MFPSSKTNTNSQKLYLGHEQTFGQQRKSLRYTPANLLHPSGNLQVGKVSWASLFRQNLSKITSMVIFERSTPEHVTYYSYTGRAVLEQRNQETEEIKSKKLSTEIWISDQEFIVTNECIQLSTVYCEKRLSSKDRHCHPALTNSICLQKHLESIFTKFSIRK